MAVDEQRESEPVASAGERAVDRLVVGGVDRGAAAPLAQRERPRQGRGARGGDRPDEAAPVGVAGARMLGDRARRHVVGIAVQIADEARELRCHVGLGPLRLGDPVEAIHEEVGVAAHVELRA